MDFLTPLRRKESSSPYERGKRERFSSLSLREGGGVFPRIQRKKERVLSFGKERRDVSR